MKVILDRVKAMKNIKWGIIMEGLRMLGLI